MTDVVLLPGLNNDARIWDGVVDALAGDATARALDLPAIDSLAGIAESILTRVPTGAVLVGHSFGGAVALELADRNPERLGGLVLINAPTDADDAASTQARRQRAEAALAGAYEDMAMQRMELLFFGERAHDPVVTAERLRAVRSYGPERYRAHSIAVGGRRDRTGWDGSRVPTLVVAAAHDEVVPTAQQRAFAAANHLDYVEIPETAHMLPIEAPDRVADIIATWCRELHPRTNGRDRDGNLPRI